jgi:hypothetical protein
LKFLVAILLPGTGFGKAHLGFATKTASPEVLQSLIEARILFAFLGALVAELCFAPLPIIFNAAYFGLILTGLGTSSNARPQSLTKPQIVSSTRP